MADVIGPIIAILLIFGVYYVAQSLDALGDTKRSKAELEKITAETRREEISVRKRELELEMGRLAIEARKLDKLDYAPAGTTEADFRVLKELEDETRDDDESVYNDKS